VCTLSSYDPLSSGLRSCVRAPHSSTSIIGLNLWGQWWTGRRGCSFQPQRDIQYTATTKGKRRDGGPFSKDGPTSPGREWRWRRRRGAPRDRPSPPSEGRTPSGGRTPRQLRIPPRPASRRGETANKPRSKASTSFSRLTFRTCSSVRPGGCGCPLSSFWPLPIFSLAFHLFDGHRRAQRDRRRRHMMLDIDGGGGKRPEKLEVR